MKNLVKILNIIVALLSVSVIIAIYSQGVVLYWFDFVPFLLISMEVMFVIATVCNLIYFRKRKVLLSLNIFSVMFIITALVTQAAGWEHPVLFGALWCFYIFIYHYTMVIKQVWKGEG